MINKNRIEIIDYMRGVACLIVLFAHIFSTHPQFGMYANGCGKIGVWCFLVISGFLATYSISFTTRKSAQEWCVWLKRFYSKKFIRLYPTYFIALLCALVLGVIPTLTSIIKHLLCLEGVGHFWYMPVIIKFYILLPIEYVIYSFSGKKGFIAVNILLGIIIAVAFPFTIYIENSTLLRWYIPVFILGMLLYYSIDFNIFNSKVTILYDVITIVIVALMLLLTPALKKLIWHIEPSSWLQNKYLLYGILWSLLIYFTSYSKYIRLWLFRVSFLKQISNYSYEIYLFHYIFLNWITRHSQNMIIRTLGTIIGTILMCIVSKLISKLIFSCNTSKN